MCMSYGLVSPRIGSTDERQTLRRDNQVAPPIPFSSWSLEAAGGHLWLSRRKAVVCTPEREVAGRVHHPRAPVRQYGGGSWPRRLLRKPID
jgi:hypothetical protein